MSALAAPKYLPHHLELGLGSEDPLHPGFSVGATAVEGRVFSAHFCGAFFFLFSFFSIITFIHQTSKDIEKKSVYFLDGDWVIDHYLKKLNIHALFFMPCSL